MHIHTAHTSSLAAARQASGATPRTAELTALATDSRSRTGTPLLQTLDPSIATQNVQPPAAPLAPAALSAAAPEIHPQVQALLDAWGTNDPAFDLDGDGIVNATDLVLMLAKLAGQLPEVATDPEAPAAAELHPDLLTTQTGEQLTVDNLLAAWGTNNPDFDLNGDGTVDAADLLLLLTKLGQAPEDLPKMSSKAEGAVAAPALGTHTTEAPANPEVQLQTRVEALLDAWGSGNPAFDLNGDGIVDSSDLLLMLARINGNGENTPNPLNEAPPAPAHHPIEQLLANFHSAGFTTAPPANLSEILSNLGLNADTKRAFMSRLAAAYPQGLGVSMIG